MKVNRGMARAAREPLAAVRAALAGLRAGGYGPAALRERLGARYPDDIGLLNRAPALERLRADRDVLAVALRLWSLEQEERSSALAGLLPAALLRECLAARWLTRRGARVRARLRLDPHADLLLLADLRFRPTDAGALGLPRGDMVYPPGSDSILLAEAVPARSRGPAYHCGGPRGDRVLRRVVEGWEAHLRPGGRALAISHLAVRRGETVADAVRPWAKGFDGRVLALVLETGTPVDLAAAQALFALDDGFAAYEREVRDWVAYLQRQRIEQVVLLLMAAERGGAPAPPRRPGRHVEPSARSGSSAVLPNLRP